MTVIRIVEDEHGFLAIAKNYKAAIHYLIDHYWLDDNSEIWDENTHNWVNIKEVLGENWKDKVYQLSLDEFFNYFDGQFYLYEDNVYECE